MKIDSYIFLIPIDLLFSRPVLFPKTAYWSLHFANFVDWYLRISYFTNWFLNFSKISTSAQFFLINIRTKFIYMSILLS